MRKQEKQHAKARARKEEQKEAEAAMRAKAEYIDPRTSEKIMKVAKEQQEEEEEREAAARDMAGGLSVPVASGAGAGADGPATEALMRAAQRAEEGALGGDDEEADDDFEFGGEDGLRLDSEGGFVEVMAVEGGDAEDEELVRRFMGQSAEDRRTLGDMVLERLGAAGGGAGEGAGGGEGDDLMEDSLSGKFGSKVVRVYKEVGAFLRRYKSGKLPKVFKMLPGLADWEELLAVTEPETWSPHAVSAATRIFASNLGSVRAQRFMNLVLLPAFRQDVHENKKLNYHLFQALRKALYKPAAFFKGFLLPLAASGDCSLMEARVVGAVLAKFSIPPMHSAVALMKLALAPYFAANSVLIRALVNKKYALPLPVIDALVDHFMRFQGVQGQLPVIWHQSLLSFAQRYKTHLTREQKGRLRDLLQRHLHPKMGPEIRREIFESPCRGEAPPAGAGGGSLEGVAPSILDVTSVEDGKEDGSSAPGGAGGSGVRLIGGPVDLLKGMAPMT